MLGRWRTATVLPVTLDCRVRNVPGATPGLTMDCISAVVNAATATALLTSVIQLLATAS